MNYTMKDLVFGTGVAHTLLLLAFVIGTGLCLGKMKIKGVSLGATWILFVGIFLSHFGFTADGELLHFLKEFGLILFVYSIGLQVGPGFFHSFRHGGVTLNLLAISIVLLACLIAYIIHLITGENLATMVGVMQGAVTNTPGLGAAQQTLSEMTGNNTSNLSSAYAVAYPIGVVGVIVVLLLLKTVFKIDVKKEREHLEKEDQGIEGTVRIACEVTNPGAFGKTVYEMDHISLAKFVVSRVLRTDGSVVIASDDVVLHEGDKVLVVTSASALPQVLMLFGKQIDMPKSEWEHLDTKLVSVRMIVTKSTINGKQLRDLKLRSSYGVSITRVTRAGMELVATPGLILQIGDRLRVVGSKAGVEKVEKLMGNSKKGLDHPNLISIFLGIAVGVLFGSIPFKLPGIPQAIKLGLAGGPLIIAILMGYFGPRMKVNVYTTTSANLMLREIGISIFLAAVGLGAGSNFIASITGGGYWWILYGAMITIIPTFVVGVVGRMFFKLNFYQICGLISGACTNPPVLAFAQNAYGSNYTSVNYATVYPLTMFMRVLMAQLMILLALA